MSQDWIELGPPKKLDPVVKNIKGSRLTVYVSPHAIPRAVRGRFDDSAGVFRIEFRYIDDSDSTLTNAQTSKDGKVRIFVGKSSSRIERIEVCADEDEKRLGFQIVIKQAEQMLHQVQSSDPSLSRRLNAKAAQQAVETTFPYLSHAPAV